MSLVIGFACNDFILFCGDTRATNNDSIISECFQKTFKFNNQLAFGIAGDIQSNYKLFSPFLSGNNLGTMKFSDYQGDIESYTYHDFAANINENYNKLQSGNRSGLQYNTKSAIGGFDVIDKHMRMDVFFCDHDNTTVNHRNTIIIRDTNSMEYFIGGEKQHEHNMLRLLNISREKHSVEKYKNIFQEVLNIGVKFDKSINNCATYEVIYNPKLRR